MIVGLVQNIEQAIESQLSGYEKIDYAFDIDKNPRHKRHKRYFVLAQEGNSADGVVGRNTINQDIEITLVRTYKEPHDDRDARQAANVLYDEALQVADYLSKNKANTAGVLNSILSAISEPTYVDESNTVHRTATINILFRV